MDEIHLGQILHTAGNIAQHLDEIVDVETPRVETQECVERAVVHVLGDDHERIGLSDHALETYDVVVMKLRHDTRFGQKVTAVLLGRADFERLDCHRSPAICRR